VALLCCREVYGENSNAGEKDKEAWSRLILRHAFNAVE
jgi:hypothetical protein